MVLFFSRVGRARGRKPGSVVDATKPAKERSRHGANPQDLADLRKGICSPETTGVTTRSTLIGAQPAGTGPAATHVLILTRTKKRRASARSVHVDWRWPLEDAVDSATRGWIDHLLAAELAARRLFSLEKADSDQNCITRAEY